LTDKKPYKVVINAFSAKLGGGQTYLRNLLPRLPKDAPLDIRIFCPDDITWPDDPRIRRATTSWPTNNPWLRAIWEKIALPRYLAKERADILFCPGGVVATKVPKHIKVITMFRAMQPFDDRLVDAMPMGALWLRLKILKPVMLKSMAEADLTIFISNYARDTIEKLRHIPNPLTINHGINDKFRTDGADIPRPRGAPDGPYILYVSRFDEYKHHDNVIAGYAALPEELRSRYKLVFLGETNLPPYEAAKAQIASLGLTDNIVVGGVIPYEDLPGWYAHADLNFYASSNENCPHILLESLASGRPLVSSDVMPMPELGGPGLVYFSPFDPASVTAAIRELLESPDKAAQVAKAAKEQSKLYSWDITSQKTWDAIVKLAAEPK
jgi:glycosyltransferase involved in cell wall biosynthesis